MLPPVGKKRGVGRQKKNRILPRIERSGKATRQVKCAGYGEKGHRRGSWRCPLTGTKKTKKTKKTMNKAGRKKAKTDNVNAEQNAATTPRTRAHIAKEAAMKARQAAQEAEAAAMEAALVAE
ncbi:hypothetical protein BS78_01G305000, partial [Paspalum vaginatum]